MASPSELRQQWLELAVEEMRPLFKLRWRPLPETLRVSVGWSSLGKRAAGVCYHTQASTDGHKEVFISPSSNHTHFILGVLAHELCHAALPDNTGHGKLFTQLGRSLGLEGKATTLGTGDGFKALFANAFVEKYGEYPAGAIATANRTKQKTAMLKCECPQCGYVARTTRKWIVEAGTPICPADRIPMDLC